MGAGRVVAVDRHAFRLDLAADLGATDCLLASEDAAETAARIRTLCRGGADVAVDASGTPTTFLPAVEALRDGGTLIEVGAFVDLGAVPFNPAVLCGRNLTLIGVGGEDARAYPGTLELLARHHERVPFGRLVTHRFPLERAADAMRTALEERGAMKVLIEPGSNRVSEHAGV
jgi:threonine dehydrogenase-like Zn-dependent dehydrogenase